MKTLSIMALCFLVAIGMNLYMLGKLTRDQQIAVARADFVTAVTTAYSINPSR